MHAPATCTSSSIMLQHHLRGVISGMMQSHVQKFGISFTTGQLMYHRRGNPLSLSVLKSIHLVDPSASTASKTAPANSVLGAATTTNVLAAVWAAKPRTKVVPDKLPEGFVQPTGTTTPFHYAFSTGSQRIACACCLFCVARSFAGASHALLCSATSVRATAPVRIHGST